MPLNPSFLILAVALAVRVGAAVYAGHFHNPTPWEYEWIADNLLQGRGYVCAFLGTEYRALCMPGYPLLCAAVYKLTGHSHLILLLIQCLVGALACLTLKAIGESVFENKRVAALSAWGLALHPGLVFYASRLHTLTFDVALFLWALLCWIKFYQAPSSKRAWVAGLSSGLAILFRGTLLPFVLLAAAGLLMIKNPGALRERIRLARKILLVLALVLAPWLIRNAWLFKEFPVFISSSGYAFWIGNNPKAQGGATLPNGRTVLEAAPLPLRQNLEQLDEMGQNRLFGLDARAFIQAQPIQALALYGRKLKAFFWFSQQTGVLYPSAYTRLYQWYYAGILALALGGILSLKLKLAQPQLLLLLGFTVSIALYQSFYYVEGRHRWTVEPVLLLFAAQGLLTGHGLIRRFR